MSTPPPPAALQDDPGQHAADAQLHHDSLRDLISMGTSLARLLHGQATAQAQAAQEGIAPPPALAPAPDASVPDAPVPDTLVSLAAAFDCTARGVRRGVLLARILARPVQPAPDPAAHRTAARKRILREVEDSIQRPDRDDRGGPALPDSLQDSLRAELRDRLDGPDLEDDIANRPPAEIITEILRDLGLDANPGTRPWQRRTPDDIRQLCARAAAPSAAHQPGARPQEGRPQDPGPQGHSPQDPGQDAARRPPGPQPDKPAATPRTGPAPAEAGSALPEDPAEAIAVILRRPTHAHARRHPPPGG